MKGAAVSVSVAFNNNRTRQLFEANTISTDKRIDALRQLKEAGIKTGALLCPVIPYITDPFQLIDKLEPYTEVIWIYGLSISDRSDQNWLAVRKILSSHYPGLVKQIEPALFSKDHLYWRELRGSLEAIKKDRQLNLEIHL